MTTVLYSLSEKINSNLLTFYNSVCKPVANHYGRIWYANNQPLYDLNYYVEEELRESKPCNSMGGVRNLFCLLSIDHENVINCGEVKLSDLKNATSIIELPTDFMIGVAECCVQNVDFIY